MSGVPQGEDKKAVPNAQLQKMLVECILLLCQKRSTRERLRALQVYPILRNFDYESDNQEASDVIYEIVNLLVRDETPGEEGEKSADVGPHMDQAEGSISHVVEGNTRPPESVTVVDIAGGNTLDEID